MSPFDGAAIGDTSGLKPLLPPGEYEVAFKSWSTMLLFGRRPKVVTFWTVMSGDYFGLELQRWYNAQRLHGKHGKHGGFAVGHSSDLLREFAKFFGRPARLDRIPMTNYSTHLMVAKVRTVETCFDSAHKRHEPLVECLRYSVIDSLVRFGREGCK